MVNPEELEIDAEESKKVFIYATPEYNLSDGIYEVSLPDIVGEQKLLTSLSSALSCVEQEFLKLNSPSCRRSKNGKTGK